MRRSWVSPRKTEADLVVVGSHRPAIKDYLLGTEQGGQLVFEIRGDQVIAS
jgi:hypothetical protein